MGRWLARLVAVLAVLAALLGPGAPASAHDVGGVGATNFRTTLSAIEPAVPGLSLTVIENGSRLELRNSTTTEVVVAGYGGEPYARVGPAGVFVNDNSPATFLNASRFSTTPVPDGVDPKKAPVWRQVETAPVLRWHDHRVHWMLSTLPPAVAADPGSGHVIANWTVRLSYGATAVTATGTLEWVPGPDPWPWLLLVAAIAAGLAIVPLLARPQRVLAAAGLVAVGAEVAHGFGVMLVETGSLGQRLGALFGSDALLIWPFAIVGCWLLWKGHTRALWIAGAAAFVMASTLLLDDAPVWWRSSAPTAMPLALNRLLVAVVVGVGLGLVAALPLLLRRHRAVSRPWSPPDGRVPVSAPAGSETQAAAGSAATTGAVALSHAERSQPALTNADRAAADAAHDDPVQAQSAGGQPADGELVVPGAGGVGRRQVAGALAAGAVGALVGAAAGSAFAGSAGPTPLPAQTPLGDVGARTVPFRGAHQAGIVTPGRVQARVWVAGFDLAPGVDRAALSGLLRAWTEAAEALTAGRGLGRTDDSVVAGLGPSALTVTVGFGPELFGKAGIALSARPAALAPLPRFAGERLDPGRGEGDLGVVIAGDDQVVVAHAARVLRRLAAGVAAERWQLSGFNSARGNAADTATPRNLMGQVDGSNNPKPTDPDFAAKVFATGPGFMAGGSYLVVRRIRMLLDSWDQTSLADQERVIGRRKADGAPLSGGSEFTAANFGTRTGEGILAIAEDAHIRRATPAFNEGAAMLRRGFSYADEESSGLIFMAWQADPRRGFIPVQRRLVAGDALGRFIRHETSALFAMPGGVGPGSYLGQGLVEG